MDPVWAARTTALLLLLGAGAAALLSAYAAAIVLVATGTGLVFLVRREAPPQVSGVAAVQAIVDDLGLVGPAHHVPCDDGVVRLFVPADAHPRRVPRQARHAVSTRPGDGIGLLVPAIAQGLEDAWSRMAALPQAGGAQGAAQAIRQALPSLGLGRDVRAAVAGDRLQVAYRPAHAEPGSDQLGRPTDALCAMLACRAMGRPVRFAGRREEEGRVLLELEAVR